MQIPRFILSKKVSLLLTLGYVLRIKIVVDISEWGEPMFKLDLSSRIYAELQPNKKLGKFLAPFLFPLLISNEPPPLYHPLTQIIIY